MITIPTVKQLNDDIIAQLETQFGITIPTVGKSFLRAFTNTYAGLLKIYYLAIANLQKNIFPDTADSELLGGTLERFGRIKLGRNPFPAVAAKYELTVTGSIGAIIKTPTTFKSDDDSLHPGVLFIVDEDYTLIAETDTIIVRALTTGIEGKLDDLNTLTATSPIALVNSSAYVSNEVIEPRAAETLADYREKLLLSYRLEPQGGAASDYILWLLDLQGLKKGYPYVKSGVENEINLFIEATIADSTDGKGTPSPQMLIDAEEVVEFDPDETLPPLERGRRPLGSFQINFLPVTIKEVDIDIANYAGITLAIKAKLLTAIIAAISKIRPFIDAADILADINNVLDINKIIGTIITEEPGASFGTVTLTIDGVNYLTYTFTNGDIPHVNSVTYS